MFVRQAGLQFKLFTGQDPPLEVMAKVIRRALSPIHMSDEEEAPAQCNLLRLLFLIGYRGTGKTTIARLLADKLGWSWLDADAVLEERYGRTIRQIFADEGETVFRDQESAILTELSAKQDCIIATGGGVVLRPENRERLKRGSVVWLRAPAEVLWQRMQLDATTMERRPDLAQGGLAEVAELLRVRTPNYEACQDFTVDTAERTPEQVASVIAAWHFGERAQSEPPA